MIPRTSSATKKKKLITCSGSLEALAQHGVLRGDAHRAGVQVALAHHDAASGDQRRGGETELVGAQKGADDHVAAGAQPAVDLHGDAVAQPVEHQHLLGLGEADLPGRAGVLDRGQRRSAGAAVVAGDGTWSACALATPAATVPTPTSETSLTLTCARRVDVLEVVDELGQVLDRIDVVVRRRRDQRDARRRVAHARDRRVDLVAGKLAAFAGLGALGHLDLDFLGVGQILGGHAEAPGGHLLDGRTHGVAVGQRLEAVGILAAFAGVRFAADAVHGDGQRLVGLAAEIEPSDMAPVVNRGRCPRRLDLVDGTGTPPGPARTRTGRGASKLLACSLTARRILVEQPVGSFVDTACCSVAHRSAGSRGAARRRGGIGYSPPASTCPRPRLRRPKPVRCRRQGLARRCSQPDAADPRGGAGEVPVDEIAIQADGLENLRAVVDCDGRDAHLGHHLQEALLHRLDVVIDKVLDPASAQIAVHGDQGLEGHVGIDRRWPRSREAGRSAFTSRGSPLSTTMPARTCAGLRGSDDDARRRRRAARGSECGRRRRGGRK